MSSEPFRTTVSAAGAGAVGLGATPAAPAAGRPGEAATPAPEAWDNPAADLADGEGVATDPSVAALEAVGRCAGGAPEEPLTDPAPTPTPSAAGVLVRVREPTFACGDDSTATPIPANKTAPTAAATTRWP